MGNAELSLQIEMLILTKDFDLYLISKLLSASTDCVPIYHASLDATLLFPGPGWHLSVGC